MAKNSTTFDPAKLARLKKLLTNTSPELGWRHEAGQLIIELAPSGKEQYRKKKMLKLAEKVGPARKLPIGKPKDKAKKTTAYFLYQLRKFAMTYSRTDLLRLEDLPWSHVKCLTAVEGRTRRIRLQEQCKDQEWSYQILQLKVQEERKEKLNEGRPKKPQQDNEASKRNPVLAESHADLALHKMRLLSQRWMYSAEIWLDPEINKIVKTRRPDDLLPIVENLAAVLKRLIREAKCKLKVLDEWQIQLQAASNKRGKQMMQGSKARLPPKRRRHSGYDGFPTSIYGE